MRPTLPFLQQRFDYFNCLCFSGSLPQVAIKLSCARSFLGKLHYQRHRSLLVRTEIRNLSISISTRYDLPEHEVEDTLLHEMIHLYILAGKMHDTSTHGQLFRSKMREINAEFGRHITVSHRLTAQMHEQDRQKRNHYICVSLLKDGRTGITLAMPSAISRLWQAIPQLPDVAATRWYLSADTFFNRYRRSRTVKIYAIEPALLSEHLDSASELMRENGRIFPRRR